MRYVNAVNVHKLILNGVAHETFLRALRVECHQLYVAGAALRRLKVLQLQLLIHSRIA